MLSCLIKHRPVFNVFVSVVVIAIMCGCVRVVDKQTKLLKGSRFLKVWGRGHDPGTRLFIYYYITI